LVVGPRITPVGGSPVLHTVAESPQLPIAVAREVDAVWEDLRRRNPRLADGTLFSVTSLSPDRIEGRFVPYRWRAVQRERPDLALGIRTLAVSGLLLCEGGVVIGRRAAQVSHAGLWELVPSGGISGDPPDWRATLLAELSEEVGIGAADVASMQPFCLIEDEADAVIDLGVMIETKLTAEDVARRHADLVVKEYAGLVVVPSHQAVAWLLARERQAVATSLALLRFHLSPSGTPTR
jgi:8-oxo-dGTP pyrophosphatase MutT (NUDIX family)